jgi:FixJ family two-component response regulator
MDAAHEQLILIVDDDAGMRQAMSRLLAAAGYVTRTFDSAQEADASQAVAHARCLVLDVHLAGVSGTHWYASLGPQRPPAVFVTAFDSAQVRAAAQQAGGSAYLTKPFDGRALISAVGAAASKTCG